MVVRCPKCKASNRIGSLRAYKCRKCSAMIYPVESDIVVPNEPDKKPVESVKPVKKPSIKKAVDNVVDDDTIGFKEEAFDLTKPEDNKTEIKEDGRD